MVQLRDQVNWVICCKHERSYLPARETPAANQLWKVCAQVARLDTTNAEQLARGTEDAAAGSKQVECASRRAQPSACYSASPLCPRRRVLDRRARVEPAAREGHRENTLFLTSSFNSGQPVSVLPARRTYAWLKALWLDCRHVIRATRLMFV